LACHPWRRFCKNGEREAKSPVAIVYVCSTEDDMGRAISAHLLAHIPALDVKMMVGSAMFEHALATPPDVIVLGENVEADAGLSWWREVRTACAAQAVVWFRNGADPRRAQVLAAGAHEVVLPPDVDGEADLTLLRMTVERVLSVDVRQQRLDADNRLLRALIEHSNDGIYTLRNNRFITANQRFLQMVGRSLEELQAPGFDLLSIVGHGSRDVVADRQRRLSLGQPVQPRYEVGVLHRNGTELAAQVSVTYVTLDQQPTSLGIFTDISDLRKTQDALIARNRELAMLHELAATVSESLRLDETLYRGMQRTVDVLSASAAGISLVSADRRVLQLHMAEGLDLQVTQALTTVPLMDDDARQAPPVLLAHVCQTGELLVIDDVHTNQRVQLQAIRASGFGGAVVIPLRSTWGNQHHGVVGVVFALFPPGRQVAQIDRSLLDAIGNLLGNAIDKARLLDGQRQAVAKLRALDEVAQGTASMLDLDGIELEVARKIHRLFGATRVMMMRLAKGPADPSIGPVLFPSYVLDDGEPTRGGPPLAARDSIVGRAMTELRCMQRHRSPAEEHTLELAMGVPVEDYDDDMFRTGVGTAVAVPLVVDGCAVGAIWLGYGSTDELGEDDLQVLSAIGSHVSIAIKNAQLFEARDQAMAALQAAQTQAVESEKLQAIGLIAHGVAHDFNNLLGSILGRAQLLSKQLDNPAHLRHVEIIEKAIHDGAETVRRIQEIGRQRTEDDFVPVDLASLVEDVVDFTEGRCNDGGVRVEHHRPEHAVMVRGKASELREVMVNLVHNAVDAMTGTEASNRVVELTWRHEDDWVWIDVRDRGHGIEASMLERIFDPYVTTKGTRGTGLGLSVSLSIVRRHQGKLLVRSEQHGKGRGTTFSIGLPSTQEATQLALPTAAEPPAGARKVLIVDDEENIRDILGEMLSGAGYEVVLAQDGAEALHLLHADEGIFIVLTDLSLPGMNGFEVAEEAKRIRPHVRIGLVTGWGATLEEERARERGVDRMLAKPFRLDEVLDFIGR
jgi:PAS domain S-box-containing protein